MTDELLTTREAAALVGVGTTSIKRWADSGLLECVKTPGGHRRFPRAAVEALVADPAEGNGRLGHVSRWVAWLTRGLSTTRLAEALLAERHERGSWIAVAEAMGAVLDKIGRAWSRGELSVIEEHIASERLARTVARCCETIEVPDGGPRCFLMAAEGDEHTLGLGLLELCLREAGWNATWAGGKTPIHFACELIDSGEVDMVAVSASEHSRDPGLLMDQARRLGEACCRQGIPLVLGGRGRWPEEPPHGERLRGFSELPRSLERVDTRRVP